MRIQFYSIKLATWTLPANRIFDYATVVESIVTSDACSDHSNSIQTVNPTDP